MFLAHISLPILVLITFCSISSLSGSFGEIQKSKMADLGWPPFDNHDVITTSYGVIASRRGRQHGHLCKYNLSYKPHFHSSYSCEVLGKGWGGGEPPLPGHTRKKKLGRDRVKYVALFITTIVHFTVTRNLLNVTVR